MTRKGSQVRVLYGPPRKPQVRRLPTWGSSRPGHLADCVGKAAGKGRRTPATVGNAALGGQRRDIRSVGQSVGLGPWHRHELRHPAAGKMLAQGVKIQVVSELLGDSATRIRGARCARR